MDPDAEVHPRGGDGARAPTVFLSAGEPSGDMHGAEFLRALRRRIPGIRAIGFGGRLMAREGMEVRVDVGELAVMGLAEVVRKAPLFLRVRSIARRILAEEGVDLVVPIDYPGFNLTLARRARSLGVPVLYYIAPQVWAWRSGRARALARDADRIAVILPFEEEIFRRAGGNAVFVGHPLLDLPPPDPAVVLRLERSGIDPARDILALLPGSRTQEVERHGALFSEAARRVVAARPDVQPVVGTHPDVPAGRYRGLGWPLLEGSRDLLAASAAGVVKSGTGTLEAALTGTPFVVPYRLNPLSYLVAKRVVRVPHVALANLVAGRRVVPELLQSRATPERLASLVLPLLDREGTARRRMVAGLAEVRQQLGQPGAAERVAELAVGLLPAAGR